MTEVTAIEALADGLDRVMLRDGTVLDVHRPSLALTRGQRARVQVVLGDDAAAVTAPYAVRATVYDRLGDSVYASAGGLLHRLPKVDAKIGDSVVIGVNVVGRRRLKNGNNKDRKI